MRMHAKNVENMRGAFRTLDRCISFSIPVADSSFSVYFTSDETEKDSFLHPALPVRLVTYAQEQKKRGVCGVMSPLFD